LQSQPHELRVGVVVGIGQVFQAIYSSRLLAKASLKLVPSFDHAAPPICDELRVDTHLFKAIAESPMSGTGTQIFDRLFLERVFTPVCRERILQ
jgi:hypothetical protein